MNTSVNQKPYPYQPQQTYFFFFQAEDGIRDDLVTGVQTCALPIYWVEAGHRAQRGHSNGVQNTLGDQCGDARVWVGSMVGGLVVAGASWGYGKKCCGLNKLLPMPMLILLLPNK